LISVGSVVQVHPDPPFWILETGSLQNVGCFVRGLSVGSSIRRGHSSAGRAPALHAGGREFDPPWLHHIGNLKPELISDRQFRFQVLMFGTMFSGQLFNNSGYIKVRRETKPRSDFGTTFFGAGIFVSRGFSPVLFQKSFIKRERLRVCCIRESAK
jgi:hypothetical protein